MELFPEIRLSWLNGWILIVAFYAIFATLLRLFSKGVVARLYDRSGWTQRERVFSAAGLPFALAGTALVCLTPLRADHPILIAGLILYLLALAGFVKALFDFRDTPLDQPVTKGLYRLSRNPQWVMFALVLVAAAIAVGSGIALLAFAVRILLTHFRILAEERACLAQYGEAYQDYLHSAPRYLLFF